MNGTQTLLARGALGLGAGTMGMLCTGLRRIHSGSARTFDRWALTLFALTRLSLYSLLFGALHLAARGDIPAYYVPEAEAVLRGALPYRDFASSYAPLHPFMDAAVLTLWHTSIALMLFAILIELLLLFTWLRLGQLLFSEDRRRIATVLYLTSALSLQLVTVDGQDNVIVALLLALSLLLAYRKRAELAGSAVGLSIAAVKFLPLMFVPAFLLGVRRWVRWALGCAAVVAIGYGWFALKHVPLLYPLQAEGSLKGASNLPFLVESALGRELPRRIEDLTAAAAVVAVVGLIGAPLRRSGDVARLRGIALATIALTLTVLLFAKKSWPTYLMMVLFPMCWMVTRPPSSRRRIALWCGFSAVAVVEHSFWASILGQVPAVDFHAELAAGMPAAWGLLVLELLLLTGYVWLLVDALRQIREIGLPNGDSNLMNTAECADSSGAPRIPA